MDKEKQKHLITEIMNEDAKDGLYEDARPKIDIQPMTQEEMDETRNTAYKYFDIDETVNDTINEVDADLPIEHRLASVWVFDTNEGKWSNNDDTAGDNHASFIAGYRKAEETLYTEAQVREAIQLAREADSIDGTVDLDVVLNFPGADNSDLQIKWSEEEIIKSLKKI